MLTLLKKVFGFNEPYGAIDIDLDPPRNNAPGFAEAPGSFHRHDTDFFDVEAIDIVYADGCRVHVPDICITYQDANGNVRDRTVSIQHVAHTDDRSEWMIKAFCQLRNANRTFRLSRIQSAYFAEDGVCLDDSELRDVLTDALNTSLDYRVNQLFQSDVDLQHFKCLIFAARADGRVTKTERSVIEGWVASKLTLPTKSDELSHVVKREIEKRDVTLHSFRRIRNALKKLGKYDEILLVCEDILGQRKSASALVDATATEMRK